MNLHDLQIPAEGALLNPRLPRAAQGGINTDPFPEDYFTPEMLEQLYQNIRQPQFVNPRYTYYAPPTWHANNARIEVRAANGTLGVDEPTFRYRMAGETAWHLPDRVEGVFLDEQT